MFLPEWVGCSLRPFLHIDKKRVRTMPFTARLVGLGLASLCCLLACLEARAQRTEALRMLLIQDSDSSSRIELAEPTPAWPDTSASQTHTSPAWLIAGGAAGWGAGVLTGIAAGYAVGVRRKVRSSLRTAG